MNHSEQRVHRQVRALIGPLFLLAGSGLGIILGFAWGSRAGSGHASDSATDAGHSTSMLEMKISSGGARARMISADESPLAAKLEEDLSMSTGVTRWLYWLEAVEKAEVRDLPSLARLAQGNSAAVVLLAERWIDLDPRHLFDTLVAASKNGSDLPIDALANLLFNEWPRRDAEAAIAALNRTQNFGKLHSWRSHLAGKLIEHDVERGLRLFSEWQIDDFWPHMTAVTRWAAADPRHAAEFTLANPAGTVSRVAIETIGQEWAKSDPRSALEFVRGQRGELESELAKAALKTWTEENLHEAAEWLATTDPGTRNRLSSHFVEAWAKQDAASALEWCEWNLTGSSLVQATGGVVKGAAEKDVAAAAGLVAAMNPSPARKHGALAIAEKWLPNWSSEGKTAEPEAVKWLASLDRESVIAVLERIQWWWSSSDHKSLADFIVSFGSEVPPYAYSSLLQTMARHNPAEAIKWAARLPEESRLAAGSHAFAEWRRLQPEGAMKWLHDLKQDDPRHAPFFEAAIRGLAYDRRAPQQLAAMSDAERAAARRIFESMSSLAEEQRAKLLEMLKPE